MRIHAVTHVPFEGPARIAEWAAERGHILTRSLSPAGGFPEPVDVDLVCIMGGPMDADDEVASPWLAAEKTWVREAIDAGASVLGVCLGAQILAEVLGGRVKRNPEREIGWFEIELAEAAADSPLFARWTKRAVVGHWHGDTFDLPPEATAIASSEACANQAFELGMRLVGLQFHLEWDAAGLEALTAACADDLSRGATYVQSAEEILSGASAHLEENGELLFELLDAMAEHVRAE